MNRLLAAVLLFTGAAFAQLTQVPAGSSLVGATNGGTGEAGTITGIPKANGASPFTAAIYTDVLGLWSGTKNSTTVPLGDGTMGTLSSAFSAITGGTNTTAAMICGAGCSFSNSNLTATRVMFSGTSGLQSDNANLLWDGTRIQAIGTGTGNVNIIFQVGIGDLSGRFNLLEGSGNTAMSAQTTLAFQIAGTTYTKLNSTLLALGPSAAFTASFPGLKRSGTSLAVRLADDSADASITASNGTFSGNAMIGSTGTADSALEVRSSTGGVATAAVPTSTLAHLVGADTTNPTFTMDGFGGIPLVRFRQAGGTIGTKSALGNSQQLFQIGYIGYGSTTYGSAKSAIQAQTTQVWTDANQGMSVTINTVPNNSTTGTAACVFDQDQSITCPLYKTTTNCANTASPAVCAAAPAGSAVIAAAATTVVVNTTAVTANSEITVTEDQSLGARLSVTCNTQSGLVVGLPRVTARSAGASFTVGVDVAPTTNPLCFNYKIVN